MMKRLMLTVAVLLGLGGAHARAADTVTSRYALIMPSTGSLNWGGKINYDLSVLSTMTASQYNPNTFVAASTNTFKGAMEMQGSSTSWTGANGAAYMQPGTVYSSTWNASGFYEAYGVVAATGSFTTNVAVPGGFIATSTGATGANLTATNKTSVPGGFVATSTGATGAVLQANSYITVGSTAVPAGSPAIMVTTGPSKGVIFNAQTTGERDAMTGHTGGLLFYNRTLQQYQYWSEKDAGWVSISTKEGTGGGGASTSIINIATASVATDQVTSGTKFGVWFATVAITIQNTNSNIKFCFSGTSQYTSGNDVWTLSFAMDGAPLTALGFSDTVGATVGFNSTGSRTVNSSFCYPIAPGTITAAAHRFGLTARGNSGGQVEICDTTANSSPHVCAIYVEELKQ